MKFPLNSVVLFFLFSPTLALAQTCFKAKSTPPQGLPSIVCAADLELSRDKSRIVSATLGQKFPRVLNLQKTTFINSNLFKFVATAPWISVSEGSCEYHLTTSVTVEGSVQKNLTALPEKFVVTGVLNENPCSSEDQEFTFEYVLEGHRPLL